MSTIGSPMAAASVVLSPPGFVMYISAERI